MESKVTRTRIGRREFLARLGMAGAAVAGGSLLTSCGASGAGGGGGLEIFSWWTSGGEVEALNALFDTYRSRHPDVEIVNAAVAGGGGAGANMKAILQTRVLGNDPPDSFQVHLGAELMETWVEAGTMEPLDSLYQGEGYANVLPASLIEIASWEGRPYGVPVNIHRNNVLWYNKPLMDRVGGTPPATWDDFFALAEKAKGQGVPAIGMAEANGNTTAHLVEALLLAKLGADGYRGLFDGTTPWDGPEVTEALETAARCFPYANPDYLSYQGSDAPKLISGGKALMLINGDWTNGLLKQQGFTDYGWAPAPETDGVYDLVSDSFGLPKGLDDPTDATNWLTVVGSKEGQDAFNPLKGSISPRSDRDTSRYDEYQMWAVEQWEGAGSIVPSLEDGSAAGPRFLAAFDDTMHTFDVSKDPAAIQAELVRAAADADFRK